MSKFKLTLTTPYSTISVEADEENVAHIGDFVDTLVRPIMLAATFANETVTEVLGEYGAHAL
jgi:hypothetical protein